MRARTIVDANKGLLTFSGQLHDAAMTLKLRHPFAPPANRTGPVIRLPLFTRLTSLVIEDSAQSLVGRMDIGLKTSARENTGITGKKARGQLSGNQVGQQALMFSSHLSAGAASCSIDVCPQHIGLANAVRRVRAHMGGTTVRAARQQQILKLRPQQIHQDLRPRPPDHSRRDHPPPPSAPAPPPAPSVALSSTHTG